MPWETILLASIPFASAAIAVALVSVVWPNRNKPSGKPVLCLLVACGIWAFFYGLELAVTPFHLKVIAAQLQYAGIVFVAPSWCVASAHAAGFSRYLSKRRIAVLLVIPGITLGAALTQPLHRLVWKDISVQPGGLPVLHFDYGPLFWINNQYAWLLLLCGTILLLREVTSSQRLFMGQRVLLILTVFVPWLANAAYIFKIGPIPGLDFTPFAFVISGFILFFGIFRYRISDVVPIARAYILENINDGLFVLDMDAKIIDLNRAGQHLLGLNPDNLIGVAASEIFSRIPALERLLESADGATICFEQGTANYEARIHTLNTSAGRSLCLIITCRNITAEVEAVATLRERELRYKDLFEESPISLWEEDFSEVRAYFDELRRAGVTDFQEYLSTHVEAVMACVRRVRILDVNRCAIAQHGAKDKNDLLANLPQVFTRQAIGVFQQELVALAQGQTVFSSEAEHKTLSGEVFWVSVNVHVVPGHEQLLDRVLVSNIDITKRKRGEEERLQLERQVQQAQKLESLGVLAGGIAHDFNNLLTAILGHASLVLSKISQASPLRESISEIESAGRRAAELCRQMLAYAGKGKFIIEPVHLGKIIDEMTPLLRTSISKKAILNVNSQETESCIEADATQIQQIVMNLVVNASESLGDGDGVITISTGSEWRMRESLLQSHFAEDLPEGNYVFLKVSDTGSGMDEETAARLFEPFFSTKFVGRGLGMSVVLGIVRGHKGTLEVQSKVGEGSTIKILFPALGIEATPRTMRVASADTSHTGSGCVLLVDDEEHVRFVGSKMLERFGFTVMLASDGREAVEVFATNHDRIDVVLLDFTMPNLDGAETLLELQRINPNVPVVLSSGYTEHEIGSLFDGQGLAGFIQKPYTLDMLREKLQPYLKPRPSGSIRFVSSENVE